MARDRTLAGALAIFALSSCQSLIDAPFDEAHPRASAPRCELKKPLPPAGVQAAPGDLAITLVVSTIDVAEGTWADGTPAYHHIGFDVDDTCTGPGVAPPCVTPEWTGADASDGPGGVDNGVGRMLYVQPQIFPVGLVTSELLNTQMQAGQLAPTAILRITNYNGTFADEDVDVELFVPQPPRGLPPMFVPRFDGTDVWPVIAEYVDNPASADFHAKLREVEAYVTRQEIVARFGPGTLSFMNMAIEFKSAILSGKLAQEGQQWRLKQGVLAGYAGSDDLLRAIPYGAFETLGIKICSKDDNYPNVKKLLCTGADAIETAAAGTNRPCNLTTFAIGIETVPVQLGAALPAPPPEVVCPPDADPGNDTCATPPTPP